ncbi:MAG TPA: aminopeptidase N [Usitatibacter sp.]|jgi:aminopeptidase N|nr:aminopeptidase N [Usitatibacter sp.]
MRDANPQPIHLKEYSPPAFRVSGITLDVDIVPGQATVRGVLEVKRNPARATPREPLVLQGENLELLRVSLDGAVLEPARYRADERQLVIPNVPDAFTLETIVRFDPWKNTRLEGLYATQAGLVTQCEAEGFRHITYCIDRPDVMARYGVTICADRARFPRLLANGNLVEQGDGVPAGWFEAAPGDGARHWARWEDPFPKPSYLFAMVAANLDVVEDHFVTRSGKRALLQIYVEPGKGDQAMFALQALKKCMRWDEEVFGLELDLERFMIVAVPDFNAGAMENKGLNIFNTKYILARADTATDGDYFGVDKVVAHEYFHNWTGNRVTCRDWFQLSLKEGLTVYRDQEYSADEYSRPVVRIQEVRDLRNRQFPEDAGPMAHPVRPESYVEVNNFYTATVYDKGAEVVRMYATMLGTDGFRRGMDLYFKRHDGQAVTCDDFRAAMADANGADLAQFGRWYSQAGTPVVECRGEHDAAARRFVLHVRQSCPPTPGQPAKEPFVIPLAVGLVDRDGNDVALTLVEGRTFGAPREGAARTAMLAVTREEERFVFAGVEHPPVPSLLRGFSAPVQVRYGYADADLAHLMAHDADPFARWEAGQMLATRILLQGVQDIRAGRAMSVPDAFAEAIARLLGDATRDPAFTAEALQLPSEAYLAECMEVADPEAIHIARMRLVRDLATRYRTRFEGAFRHFTVTGPYSPDAQASGRRALRNTALAYIATIDDATSRALAFLEFRRAENMTDAMAALTSLANSGGAERERALAMFHDKWKDEALVVDKWFRVQATSWLPATLERVKALAAHPAFDVRNPNRVRALVHAFALDNPLHFHAADGSGYRWVAEQVVALDRLNPQVASRLARAFDRWRKYDPQRQEHGRRALESIRGAEGLSGNVGEVVGRALE